MSGERQAFPFTSIYRHGYVRVAAAVPRVRIGDPAFNAQTTIALAEQASSDDATLVVFPELGITAIPATICSTRMRCSKRH